MLDFVMAPFADVGTLTDLTDIDLLRAWEAGDKAAGSELVERHYRSVERFFHNKLSDPDDLIQATFLACCESAHRFLGHSSFRTFLLGIANIIWLKHCKRRFGPRTHAALKVASVMDLSQTPIEILEGRDDDRLLLAALRRLPIALQVVLELRYWERLKVAEVAEVLDEPLGTVQSRIGRGKKKLKELLEELAKSPEQLHSTLTRLEDWARRVRDELPSED